MRCPICNGKTSVSDSRPEDDCINRTRKCAECGHTFFTVEIDRDLYERLVRKNDKNRKR
jgi:transcriptional regulator NrdR family protein